MGFFSNLTNTNSKKSNLEEIKLLYETTSDEYEIEEGVEIESYYGGKAEEVVAIIESLSKCKDIEHSEFIYWKAHLYCFIGELKQKARDGEMNDYFKASIIEFDSIEEEVPFFVLYPESPIALNVKKYTSDEMNCLSGVRYKFAAVLTDWEEEDWAEEVIIENINKSEENFEKEPLTLYFLASAYEQAFMFYKKSDFSKSNSYAKKGIKLLESRVDLESEMNTENHSLFRFKYNYMVQQRQNDRAEADKLEKELGLYFDLKDFERLVVLAAPPIFEINPKKNLLQINILDKFNEMQKIAQLLFRIFYGLVEKPDDMEKDLTWYFGDNYNYGNKLLNTIKSIDGIPKIEVLYWEGHLNMYLANIDSLFQDRVEFGIERFELAIDLFAKLDNKHKSFRFYEASPISLGVQRFTNDRLFHLEEARRLYAGFLTQFGEHEMAEEVITKNITHCEKRFKEDPKTYYSLGETYNQAGKFFWTEDLNKADSFFLKAINTFEKNEDLESYISLGLYTPLEANWNYLANLEKMDADANVISSQNEKVSLYVDDVNDQEAISALFDIQRKDHILPKGSVNSFDGPKNFG